MLEVQFQSEKFEIGSWKLEIGNLGLAGNLKLNFLWSVVVNNTSRG
jgi:hypothetical protein